MDITPSKQQQEAIDAVIEWYRGYMRGDCRIPEEREFYLAGFAGSGKTSIAKYIVELLRKEFNIHRFISAAYMGKAVDVLRNKGMINPMTIHSMLYIPTVDPNTKETIFELSPFAPIYDKQLVILDEVSMVDKKMAGDLRSFGIPMLILGDPAQLPPIGGTGFTVGRKPDYFLTEIHRQVENSPILKLATMARNGDPIKPGVYGDNVLVTDQWDTEILNKYVMKKGTQPICGSNKTRHSINRSFRKRLGLEEWRYPQIGEKIICKQNDAGLGLFNGMMGRAYYQTGFEKWSKDTCNVYFEASSKTCPIKTKAKSWKAVFDANYSENMKPPEYKKGILKFDWAYCLTCHASQGSEWDTVTVIDESHMFRNDASKHLYTAITRAQNRLILIQK